MCALRGASHSLVTTTIFGLKVARVRATVDDDLHEIFRQPRVEWGRKADDLRPLDQEAGQRRAVALARQEERQRARDQEAREQYRREVAVRRKLDEQKAAEAAAKKRQLTRDEHARENRAATPPAGQVGLGAQPSGTSGTSDPAQARRNGARTRGAINRDTNGDDLRERLDAAVGRLDDASAIDLLRRLVNYAGDGDWTAWQEDGGNPRDDVNLFIWSGNLTKEHRRDLASWLQARNSS